MVEAGPLLSLRPEFMAPGVPSPMIRMNKQLLARLLLDAGVNVSVSSTMHDADVSGMGIQHKS